VCGVNACQALVERRSDDIIRVYVSEERIKTFSNLLKWCAETKRAYHVVSDADLERITETHHHEGVCLLVKQRSSQSVQEWLLARKESLPERECVVFLENVANPHNLGAIIRVCSHFGASTIVIFNADETTRTVSSATFRTAEGGAESVDVLFLQESPGSFLKSCKGLGFTLVATSSHYSEPIYSFAFPARTLILFGSESNGLSLQCYREAQKKVAIPGTGAVESLNVACAATAVLSEYWRVWRQTK
jgi:TrmH RNA methyltransferase